MHRAIRPILVADDASQSAAPSLLDIALRSLDRGPQAQAVGLSARGVSLQREADDARKAAREACEFGSAAPAPARGGCGPAADATRPTARS